MIVDEVQDTADIVVKPINRLLKSLSVYSGATILGDGSIALILDVMGIAKIAKMGTEDAGSEKKVNRALEEKSRSEIQEYLLIRLNSPTKHAIVLGYVYRLEEFKRSDLELSGSQRVVRYGKSILPILSVSESLGFGAEKTEKPKDTMHVVVVEKAGLLYGLEVDEILDTLSSDVELDSSLVKQVGLFGNLNTAQELIVVIDPFALIGLTYPEAMVKPVGLPAVLPPPATTLNRKLKILLAEDTFFFRKAIATVLVKAGHEVIGASDGREALDVLEKGAVAFDLIISDIEMPRMNGFEFAQSVRASRNFSKVPMLAISSRADSTYQEKGIQAGFNVYLEKLKPDLLLSAVTALVNQERQEAA